MKLLHNIDIATRRDINKITQQEAREMELDALLNEMIGMINESEEMVSMPLLRIINQNRFLYVGQEEIEGYNLGLELVYNFDKTISSNFSRKNIYKYIKDKVFEKRSSNKYFTKPEVEIFFKSFLELEPKDCTVVAPISGIRLDTKDKVNMSIFEVGRTEKLSTTIGNIPKGYYISVDLENIYDDEIAMEIATNKFNDFIRLIAFISGKEDKSIYIKVGLPLYPSMSPEKIYTESTSYQIVNDEKDEFGLSTLSNMIVEKLPLDNPFFESNLDFDILWDIYKEDVTKKNKMRKRLLNASIAIGESILSKNIKNSIIYTSMAFEILFSLNESSLFQPSIADKLAESLVFIVCTDKESRIRTNKSVKKFYSLRSALVHGANPQTNHDYIMFNRLLSASISQLLNNNKYKSINSVQDLYEMKKEAQFSY